MTYPIMSASVPDAKDERSPGVVLLFSDADTKVTAEDCGLWWYIRDWEAHDHDGLTYWFDRSGYAIQKDMIKQLAALS